MTLLMLFENHFFFAASWGQAAFIGVFLVTLIGVLIMPRAFLGQDTLPAWWKNVRVWAAFICLVQIVVYWVWG